MLAAFTPALVSQDIQISAISRASSTESADNEAAPTPTITRGLITRHRMAHGR